MTNDRFRNDRGFVDPKELPKGPNGRPLCRFCSKETAPPKRTFCSDDCVRQFKIQSSASYMRKAVMDRDHGVCSKCGLDTVALKKILYRVLKERGRTSYDNLLWNYKLQYGYDFALDKHSFEVDHIQAVALGGGSCGLDNLKTLCVPCHRAKTKLDMRKIRRRRQCG